MKTDGAKIGVAAIVVMGEEGAIWVTGSCIQVVSFTRGEAKICVCSWSGLSLSGKESSFRFPESKSLEGMIFRSSIIKFSHSFSVFQ